MVLRDHFDEEIEELFEETDFQEEPRRLDEILAAETEMFDRIWYHRSLQHDYRAEREGDTEELERHQAIARPREYWPPRLIFIAGTRRFVTPGRLLACHC